MKFKVDQNTTVGDLVNRINRHPSITNSPATADLSVEALTYGSKLSAAIDLDKPEATLSEIGLLEGQTVFADLGKLFGT